MESVTTEHSDNCSLRPIRCELNILSKPDGSVILAQGETVVIASMYGPSEVKLQKLKNDRAAIDAVFIPKSGLSLVGDRWIESFIRNSCEAAIMCTTYPRTGVTITVQEVQDFGGLLACAVNAAALATINSGIEMKFLIAAVSCVVNLNDGIIVDPDVKQLDMACKAKMTFVFESNNYNVVASHTEGAFSQVQYQQALLKCRIFSKHIFKYFRETVKRYITNS